MTSTRATSIWHDEAASRSRTSSEPRALLTIQPEDIEQGMPIYSYEPLSMDEPRQYEPSHDVTPASVLEPVAADSEDLLRSPVAPHRAFEMMTSASPSRPWTEDEDFSLVYAIALYGETNWERIMSERAVDVGDLVQDHPEGAFPVKYLPALGERGSTEGAMSRWKTYWSSRFVEIGGHNYVFSDLFARSQEAENRELDRMYHDVDMYMPSRTSMSSPTSSSSASHALIPTFATGPTDSGVGLSLGQPHRPRSKSLGTVDSISPTFTLTHAPTNSSTSSPTSVPVSVPTFPRLRTAMDPLRGGGRQRRQGFARHPPLLSSPLKQTVHGYVDAQPASPTKGDEENHAVTQR